MGSVQVVSIGAIVPWIFYRVFRIFFWVIDGFRNPKE